MKLIYFIILVFFAQCAGNNREKQTEAYFKEEIDGRIQKINELKIKDSLDINPKQIDDEINKLVLMSKDIENIKASINKSKMFFDTIAVKLNINRKDFIDIDKTMTLEEIATALKSNELNIFNQVIFKHQKGGSSMYTAQ